MRYTELTAANELYDDNHNTVDSIANQLKAVMLGDTSVGFGERFTIYDIDNEGMDDHLYYLMFTTDYFVQSEFSVSDGDAQT
jgi:hypothetical protein